MSDNLLQKTSIADLLQQLTENEANALRIRRLIQEAHQEEEAARRATQGVNACGRTWRDDGSCSYCGSMTVAEAIRRLKTPGTRYSGADWKYGWPHKFYIESASSHPMKFYNNHLADATEEEFAEFVGLSDKLFGVKWGRDEKGVKWAAVGGIQLHGTIRVGS